MQMVVSIAMGGTEEFVGDDEMVRVRPSFVAGLILVSKVVPVCIHRLNFDASLVLRASSMMLVVPMMIWSKTKTELRMIDDSVLSVLVLANLHSCRRVCEHGRSAPRLLRWHRAGIKRAFPRAQLLFEPQGF